MVEVPFSQENRDEFKELFFPATYPYLSNVSFQKSNFVGEWKRFACSLDGYIEGKGVMDV
jgi:hypothetical protein